MKQYSVDVDIDNRNAMINYLEQHFKYYEYRNNYANNIKIYNLGLTSEQTDALYKIYEADDSWLATIEIDSLIADFESEFNGNYTAFSAGRSGGYLILARKDNKPWADCRVVGLGDDSIYDYYEDWSDHAIREVVELVQRFDKLCDDIVETVVYMIDNYEVVEETYTVTKTRTVLREKEAS